MADYKKQYLMLFNCISDIIKTMEIACKNLKKIQQKTEQSLIVDESNEPEEE